MKSALVVTWWGAISNYGSILQAYAVSEVLKEFGYKAVMLKVCEPDDSIWKKIKRKLFCNPFRFIYGRIYKWFLYEKDLSRKTAEFCNKNLHISEKIYRLDTLSGIPKYNLYVVGSDQMWNFTGEGDERYAEERLLAFAPEKSKKISFAVSFGGNSFPSFLANYASEQLKTFDFVSVREKSGVDVCKKLGFANAVYHPDPTFLLSADDYRTLYDGNENIPRKRYVLLYLLNNSTRLSLKAFYKWAEKEKLEVVYVNGNMQFCKFNFYKKTYATVTQWLKLIDHAEYVFTNSYHGTIFSLVFNKKFVSVLQNGKIALKNERFKSLFEEFDLKNRIYNSDFDRVKEDLNYSLINEKLTMLREKSCIKAFLKEIYND